jgi:predicted ATP-grasp superfamily ATP-dependent carboligase
MRTPVLLTVDESTGSLAAVRALAAGGYAPHIATFRDGFYATRSRAARSVVIVPDAVTDPEPFVRTLAGAALRLGVAAVLPGSEATLRALSGREDMFPASVPLGTCSPDVTARALDKTLLHRLAPEAGLEIPETIELSSHEVMDQIGTIRFPVVVKPPATVVRSGRETRSVPVVSVRDAHALRATMAAVPPGERRLVQRAIAGELYSVSGVSWRGDVVCSFHQVARRIWPPETGGSSYAIAVAPDDAIDAGVRRLMRLLGWDGIFCIQFLKAGDRSYLIDVNPRVYGSLALAVAAGHNLPAIWADLVLGRSPRLGPVRSGLRFRSEEDDLRALVRLFRAGRRREAVLGLLPRPNTVHPIWWWRDPAPFATTVGKLIAWSGSAWRRE